MSNANLVSFLDQSVLWKDTVPVFSLFFPEETKENPVTWGSLLKSHYIINRKLAKNTELGLDQILNTCSDLEFVKKFTPPNFWAEEFYTLKTRKSRLFSLAINSKNASLSVIWPSFGHNRTQCVIYLTVMKKVYIYVCVNLQNI